jgi:hypothetical protein
MIQISYSPPNHLEISGNPDALQTLQRILLDLAATRAGKIVEISVDAAFDPAPYERALAKMVIRVGRGPTNITLQGDAGVYVEGSPDNLERLASFFDFALDAGEGQHQHYEYFEGNEYIAPDAIPLVIHLAAK